LIYRGFGALASKMVTTAKPLFEGQIGPTGVIRELVDQFDSRQITLSLA